jgi:amino acid adenylation domain-containing protein
MCNHKHWEVEVLDLDASHRVLQKTTIGFDASVFELFSALQVGGTVVMAPPGAQRDMRQLVAEVRRHGITHLVMTPSAARALLEEPDLDRCDSLQYLLFGGEALDPALVRAFRSRLPRVRIGNFYGPSETTEDATHHEVIGLPDGSSPLPIGRPVANMRCHVLDPAQQPVPVGVVGELYIGGIGLSRGYLKRPELTAERFVADPFQPGERLYRTGDLARYRSDGALVYVGRADAQIKVRGQRIEPGEVEATLLRCPGVRRAAVIARKDTRGDLELAAYVVAEPYDESALRRQLHEWLPAGWVPARLAAMRELPTLPNGKVDLRALAVQGDAAERARPVEAPRSATERRVQALWTQLLGRQPIGVHDNFFESGGHSLIATQLVARIRTQLGADLPLRSVFERPTIASLASEIDGALGRQSVHRETPITAVPRDRPLPLSYSQQRMWLVQQMDPQGSAYNMPFAARIRGTLDVSALQQALTWLAERHEALRTGIHLGHGGAAQVIAASVAVAFQQSDLSSELPGVREARARELAQRESRRPFDLTRPPLWRVLLLRLQPQEHVLLIVIHHVIADQWSGGVLVRDLAQAYRSAGTGHPPVWSALRIQYGDYAVWQRTHQSPAALRAELDHWADRLRTTPSLALPVDGGDATQRATPGAMLMRALTPDTIRAMRTLAAAHDATPFMVLLATFKLLLSRYCGQTDIAIGTPIANRMRADTEELVGTMVNTLVLRTELAGSHSFRELLLRVKDTALQAYAHQNLPYEQLVDALRGDGGAASPAHVRVLFNVPNAPWMHPELPGTAIEPFDFDRGAAQFDLAVTVDTEHFHRVHIEYATALFSRDLVQQLASHYVHLLQQVLTAPEAPLASLRTLTVPEWNALQTSHGATARELPPVQRVDQLLSAQAARTPDAIALSQGAQRISYRELEHRANQLAHRLQSLGAGRGTLIGLCLQRSPEMVVALLAVMKAGAAYVPLDPAFPRDRLRFMIDDAALAWVITHDAVHDVPAPASGRVLNLDHDRGAAATAADAPPRTDSGLRDLAYVLYTSGSTGRPKGVQIEHRSLLNFITSMAREPGAGPNDTLLAVTTLSFDIAGLELLLPLATGGRVEVASRDEAADPQLLIERLAAVQPTLMQATPATWRMLLEAGWSGDPRLTVLCGGEALSAELATRLRPRCHELWNLYGPTETTIWSTVERIEADSPITIGRPIDNTACVIVDAQLQPVPAGVAGELCIGGLGVARGYHGRPDLTAERFVPDPFAAQPDQRLYRTGDIAKRLPDGRLMHLGRDDFQVKVRGFRIELGDIESALAAHASVAHGVATAIDDGAGSKQLVAYVVTRSGASFDAQALRAHLRAALPDYMVPSYIVPLSALPMTANRKVDVKALPRPSSADAAARETRAADDPQSLLAVQLLALWRQVLDDDALGLDDNFFERGGHSLKAVQLLTQIERVFGRRLPLATLVEAPTIAQLEQVLSRADWAPPWRSLVALAVHGERAPLFLVPGVGGNVLVFTALARLLEGERPVYGLQARGLDGIEAPFRSMTEMAAHHVAEMRSVQPHGPYLIGGACTGGVVAYEMAQQLRAQGESVELLVLESWHPSSYRPPSSLQRARMALRAGLKRLRASAMTLAGLPMARWPGALQRVWQPRAHSDVTLQETLAGHDYLADRVVAATFEAVASYEAQPYPDRLLNVIASARPLPPGVIDTRPMWDSLARGGSRHIELPAQDSGRLFVSPHVEQLSGILREYVGTRL